jgi:hypothetical protein
MRGEREAVNCGEQGTENRERERRRQGDEAMR